MRVELTTARLHLRPFTPADHEAIHAVYSDPEVMRHVGHGAHATLAETANALRIYGDVLARRGYSFLAVTERETGTLLGDGGLHPLGGVGPDVELGYTLARDAWGRGYATELGRALVIHAFQCCVPRGWSRRSSPRTWPRATCSRSWGWTSARSGPLTGARTSSTPSTQATRRAERRDRPPRP